MEAVMDTSISGRVLIVGGRSGIGEAFATHITANYPKVEFGVPDKAYLDITNHKKIRAYFEKNGAFTHIVYSAGVNQLAWATDSNIDNLMGTMFDINCAGFVQLISEHVTQFPTAYLSAVAVSSDAGRIPMRGSVAYCASKAALNMAVKVLARELAPLHRINAVAPGMVADTPMTHYIMETLPGFRDWSPDWAARYEKMGTPTGRRATKEEVSQAIAFLLFGPDQMTGTILDINGGR
jgi:NAD(P)-dependent dehydrogenase (short-subunit alcohol dehydrogenase family)